MTSPGLQILRYAPKPPARARTAGPLASFQMALLDRAHQQAAVAALGQAALSGVDLGTLLEQAAAFVAQTLSLDFASIFELSEDGRTLRMTAGFGWSGEVIGKTTVSAQENSMGAYVLASSEPVIVLDACNITAFEIPEFVRTHGIVSGISVIIPGARKPWGILEAHNRGGKIFDEDDFHFLQSVANVISTAHARKQSETDREHLAAFVEDNPNPVIDLDDKGRVIYCNRAARVMAGTLQLEGPDELLPSHIIEIVRHCLTQETRVLKEESRIGERTFSWSFFPVGRIGRVHAYAVDITEQISLEAQLRQSQKMEAIGQLAAGVAHDFNNILTIMQGLVRRLGLTASHDQNDTLEQLFETTERAASLTKQLLAFSRRQVLQRHVLSLGEIVANMSRMLQRLIGEDITLTVEQVHGVPPIEADAATIEQVVLNLAVNARDAMPRGGHLIISTDTFQAGEEPPQETWVRLRVRDTGSGISPEVKTRMFEPFYTTKEVGKGTGLGLATVFGIVKQHGGFIGVESELGQGATFTILFPPSDKAVEIAAEATDQPTLKRGTGETILLVEDEPLLRELAHIILVEAGYKVLDAGQSEEAFTIWRQHHDEIDLLLTDMVLPGGMTGRELAAELQQGKPQLKVIYTTGYSQDMVESKGATLHFLQKPYPPETLMRAVRSCLDCE
jgi:two-component system, cell cycle sensor histidine kinase and response regulator CckA